MGGTHAMHPAFVAAERAVHAACRIHMDGGDARKLVRGEIDRDTFDEIRSQIGRNGNFFDFGGMMRRTAPLVHNGVSFYLIENLPVPWRVFGLGITTGGRLSAIITDGEPRDAKVG